MDTIRLACQIVHHDQRSAMIGCLEIMHVIGSTIGNSDWICLDQRAISQDPLVGPTRGIGSTIGSDWICSEQREGGMGSAKADGAITSVIEIGHRA
jgi:hypothetical protein